MMVIAMTVTLFPAVENAAKADDEPYNLSEGRAVYASSSNGGDTEDKAVDGKENTRWQAEQSDTNEWLYVDLGKVSTIDHIYLHWENAYAKTTTSTCRMMKKTGQKFSLKATQCKERIHLHRH